MPPDPKISAPLSHLSSILSTLPSSLHPLLTTPTSQLSTPLPLLDKAKLQILTAYAIESLLFSAIKLSGANVNEHPIRKELERTKGYFGKVKGVEEGPEQRKMKVDAEAVGRFVRHGLAGNDAKKASHIKFGEEDGVIERTRAEKRKGDDADENDEAEKEKKRAKKKRREERQKDNKEKSKKDKREKGSKSSKPAKNPKEAFQALVNK